MDFSSKRITSTLIDHLFFGFIASIIVLPGLLFDLIFSSFELQFHYGSLYLNTIAMAIYIGKDLIAPNSPGKRFTKLILISSTKTQEIKSYDLLLRNLTFFIWPIEILFELLTPERRLGDIIARTRVLANSATGHRPTISISARIVVFLFTIVLSYALQLQIVELFDYLNSHLANTL